MPIYEYRCEACGVKFSVLVSVQNAEQPAPCPKCSGCSTHKLVSRFRRGRDEGARLDEIADRAERSNAPETDREMREFVRDIGHALDDGVADEMEEMVDTGMFEPETENFNEN